MTMTADCAWCGQELTATAVSDDFCDQDCQQGWLSNKLRTVPLDGPTPTRRNLGVAVVSVNAELRRVMAANVERLGHRVEHALGHDR